MPRIQSRGRGPLLLLVLLMYGLALPIATGGEASVRGPPLVPSESSAPGGGLALRRVHARKTARVRGGLRGLHLHWQRNLTLSGASGAVLAQAQRGIKLFKHLGLPTQALGRGAGPNGTQWAYLDNQQLEEFLRNFTARCAHISRLYSIGKSASGVPLWVLQLGRSPKEDLPLPTFKYVGGMHGDEPVGRQLLVYLADWLCDNYPSNPRAVSILEQVQVHLLPAMNPDGFALRRRENANGIDLNRDFPDPWFFNTSDESRRQPEVAAVMQWIRSHHFVLSASLHGGALVASYPWDGNGGVKPEYAGTPDDPTFRFLAAQYSRAHAAMWRSTEFKDGITNGASWYPLYGGMEDWNYIVGDCFEITIELHDNKWPPALWRPLDLALLLPPVASVQLPGLWDDNRNALLTFIELSTKVGIHGSVRSRVNKRALEANVSISGNSHVVRSRLPYGLFYRIVVPGTYQVTVSCAGYKNVTQTVTVKELVVSRLDVVLDTEEGSPEDRPRTGAATPRGGDAGVGATATEMSVHRSPKDPRPLLNGAAQRHERIERGQRQRQGPGPHSLGLYVQTYQSTMVILFAGVILALAVYCMRRRTRHRTMIFRGKKPVAGR